MYLIIPLGIGKVAFACDTSGNMKILAGKIDNSTLEILTSESGVLRYEEVSGETVNPFVVDADTLDGSTKEQIISEAQSGLDLSNIDAATLEGHAANYFATASDMNSCFQSVSEGKSAIASAITDKGVSTASDATFQTMASNIDSIISGSGKYEVYDSPGMSFWALTPETTSGTRSQTISNPFSQGAGIYTVYGYARYSVNSNPILCWKSSGTYSQLDFNFTIVEDGENLIVNFNYEYGYDPGWRDGVNFTNLLICKQFT